MVSVDPSKPLRQQFGLINIGCRSFGLGPLAGCWLRLGMLFVTRAHLLHFCTLLLLKLLVLSLSLFKLLTVILLRLNFVELLRSGSLTP